VGRLIPVSECFGPVWQGEGPHVGRRCSFLRLGLCNLHCEWCDTPYTWDNDRYDVSAECPDRDTDWIVEQVSGHNTDVLVLSGGEPLIHGWNVTLLDALDRLPHAVHVETNGTLLPPPGLDARVAHWSVSPKIAQMADPEKRRIRPDVLNTFARREHAILKVVARHLDDLIMLATYLDSGDWGDWAGRVWIMPEGVTPDEVLGTALDIADDVAAFGWNLTLRQHTLLYGTERAR
jgi:organic radical activating enzyme